MVTIYTLTNPATGEFYVGQTKDLKKRAWDHLWLLRKRRHYPLLQKSYDDNPCVFVSRALLMVRDEDGDHYEKEVIRIYGPTLNATSNGKGGCASGENHPSKRPEVRAKLRANHPMKRPEVRAKISGDNNPMKSPEVVKKRTATVRAMGENHPSKRPEVRAKFSGENNPMKRPEVTAKHSANMKRPEVRAKISAAAKAQWAARRTTNAGCV